MTDVIKLSDFFNSQFVNYACYDNTRKIASYIDGLKSGSRKVAYTVLEKNIVQPLKASQLSSKVAEFAEYLHGSLEGVIVTMGQDYCGTNNQPLIQKKGNFGTRFTPEASAARYIFASGSDFFFKVFNREDTPIIESQMLEGSVIEPKFYVPSLPVILINGSEGVSSGFAQKILPRNPTEVKEAILGYLNGTSIPPLKPWFKDFKGTVEQGETAKQWLIKGNVKRIAQNKVQIDEIPIGYDLKGYIAILDSLQDSGVIADYKDLSSDSFNFIVTIPRAKLDDMSVEQLLSDLKLVKKITENYTCMTEDNSIETFESITDILARFVAIKLRFLKRRKEFNIDRFQANLALLESKIKFLSLVVGGELAVNKRPLADIEKDLEAHNFEKRDGSWDYLLGMKIWNLTQENLDRLIAQRDKDAKYLQEYIDLSLRDIWNIDLQGLELA